MPHHQLSDSGFEVTRTDHPHPKPEIAQGPSELVLHVLQLVADREPLLYRGGGVSSSSFITSISASDNEHTPVIATIPGRSRTRSSQLASLKRSHCAVERHGCRKLGRSTICHAVDGASLSSNAADNSPRLPRLWRLSSSPAQIDGPSRKALASLRGRRYGRHMMGSEG